MNFLARDFYIAANKVVKERRHIRIKKNVDIDSFNFETPSTREELKKDLSMAEDIYNKLSGTVNKKKLAKIANKIESLKIKLEEETKITDEVIEYDGIMITPPIIEDLQEDLEELDKELNIPELTSEPDKKS